MRLLTTAAFIVSVAVFVVEPSVAEIVALVAVATAAVEIVNDAELEPAVTVTDAGTVALVVFDATETVAPPGPAAPVNVMVAVDVFPPITATGDRVMLDRAAGVIVNCADWVLPLSDPLIVAVTALDTAVVVTENVAVEDPPGTITDPGAVAAVLLEESATVVPPLPAAPLSVTVPVELAPP